MGKLAELPRFTVPTGGDMTAFRERIHRLETTDAERFAGDEPVDAAALYGELLDDYSAAYRKYYEKRIRLCGTVAKIGADEYGAPSFQLTSPGGGRCFALIVFPNEEIYGRVGDGDYAEIIGNVVFIREPYGLVVKKSELLEVKHENNNA